MLGRGLHRDSADHPWRKRQRDARALLGSAHLGVKRVPGTTVSLRKFEIPTFNQLSCEGCVGHAFAMAVATALATQGQPLDFIPSPGDVYKLARAIGRGAPDVPLSDTGSMLADAATAISTWGLRPIGTLNPSGNTDVTSTNVNEEPGILALEQDANTMVVGEYRLDLATSTWLDDLCALLDGGIPIARGSFVDSAYENYSAGQIAVGVPNEADPNGGGHATVITGYHVLDAEEALAAGLEEGDIIFEDKTSWGDAFGDHGHVLITAACMRASWDVYPMSIARVA